ncbi:MAG: hypothetical protein R2788_02660 [Saprospiraceae bacterium]
MWGDAPFSEASQANADEPIYGAAFDFQKDIYTGAFWPIWKKCRNQLLSGMLIFPSIKGDIIYHGDLENGAN